MGWWARAKALRYPIVVFMFAMSAGAAAIGGQGVGTLPRPEQDLRWRWFWVVWFGVTAATVFIDLKTGWVSKPTPDFTESQQHILETVGAAMGGALRARVAASACADALHAIDDRLRSGGGCVSAGAGAMVWRKIRRVWRPPLAG